jgi:large subunit ribosomal protein L29
MAKKLKTKTEEVRKLSDKDLAKELEEVYRRLISLRMQKMSQQLTNHRELPKLQRQIARLKTIRRERELARLLAEEGR